jgi:hypothetical protein
MIGSASAKRQNRELAANAIRARTVRAAVVVPCADIFAEQFEDH